MKIQKLSTENRSKVYALLARAFAGSSYEGALVQKLHENGKDMQEWVCIHTNRIIAYIAFTPAYRGDAVCGLHLAPMAVTPEFQKQGVGSELLRFALRQDSIRNRTLFVLGAPAYYSRFGFEPCAAPLCPFDRNNAHFLCLRNETAESFSVGYEPEFLTSAAPPAASKPPKPKRKKRR